VTTIQFSEARKCPECKQDGAVAQRRAIEGGTLVNMQCENEACPWYGTQWLVELDANSEVQVNEQAFAIATGRHLYKKPDPVFAEMHDKVHRALGRQLAEETGKEPEQ
jgi:hypothetical protein